MLKGLGYSISIVSVLLLGAATRKSGAKKAALKPLLVGGMATSVAGMVLRWLSAEQEEAHRCASERARPDTRLPQG